MQNLPDKARSSPRRRPQAARSGRRLYPSARPGPASAGRRARGDLPPAQGPTAGHRPRRAATTACPGKGSQPGAERTGQAVPPVLPGAVRAGARTSPVRTSPDPTGAATGGPRPTLAGIRIVGRDMAPGEPGRKPAEPTDPRRRRAEREAVRLRAAELFAQEMPTSSVADRLGVARQTAVSWRARWRETGATALRSHGPSRRPAVPDSQLPAIEKACSRALAPTASTVTCGPRPGSRRSSSRLPGAARRPRRPAVAARTARLERPTDDRSPTWLPVGRRDGGDRRPGRAGHRSRPIVTSTPPDPWSTTLGASQKASCRA